ncbi:MAG: response regulator, partial [candidate division WOR-3 bacterium]|nr:response regulator [candidate division WOR-3 bacterium]
EVLEKHKPLWEKGGTTETEYYVHGKSKILELTITPAICHGKRVVFGIGKDITDRKKAEKEKEKLQAQLIQSAKMAAVGVLASGIAHGFNNLLQIMMGHVALAQRTKKRKDMKHALNIVLDTSDRAAKVIKDLLAFSRPELSEKELYDITEAIESVLSLAEEQLKKHNIKMVRKYERIPMIEVNKAEIQQVFLAIVINARDAMLAKGGELEICVKQVKGNIEVSFSDTGKGIEKDNLSKIFEPFYTTKGAFGGSTVPGMGLGLSVSYGIIQRHRGTIEVDSRVGRGTTFTVKLPVEEVEPGEKIVKEPKKKEIKKAKVMNILVVDDEREICKIFANWLSVDGHRVKSVLTGKEAIELVKNEHFNVAFLDIIMPGISGNTVLEEIKKISPKTKVVMITGKLMSHYLLTKLRQKGASGCIEKPFGIEEIKEALV